MLLCHALLVFHSGQPKHSFAHESMSLQIECLQLDYRKESSILKLKSLPALLIELKQEL